MSEIKIPKEQCIDGFTEPIELVEVPYASQYYIGYMRKGWNSPTLLFVERWNPEVGLFPLLDGWVVRAEPAGNSSFVNSLFLSTDQGDPWKYKKALRFPTLENAVQWLNSTLDLYTEAHYNAFARSKKLDNIIDGD